MVKNSFAMIFSGLKQFVLIAILVLPVSHATASDAYLQYIANLHLLESHQALVPEKPIRYTDSQDGQLLKSVLGFDSAMPMMAIYFANQQTSVSQSNLPNLLAPILTRYQNAFAKEPRTYEAEYLDALEITAFQMQQVTAHLHSQQSLTASKQANHAAPNDNKALVESVQRMVKSVEKLNLSVMTSVANSIRKDVATRRFSEVGAVRALRIADFMSPLASVPSPNLSVKESLATGEKVYMANCAPCHQKNGQGIPGAFPTLIGATSLQSPMSVVNFILVGKGSMPSWKKTLSATDIAAVATYIREKFGNETAPLVTVENVEEALRREKAMQ